MEAKKTATIVADISATFIVFLIGLTMLPFPTSLVWGAFNVWLWIVAPPAILWANKKEEGKSHA